MVEESSRRTTHILDVPLAIDEHELAMFAAHDLRLEAYGRIGGLSGVGNRYAIAL